MNKFIQSIFYDEHGKLKPCMTHGTQYFRCVAPFTLCGHTFPAGEIWECSTDYLRFCCDNYIISLEHQETAGVSKSIEIDYKSFSECFELIENL